MFKTLGTIALAVGLFVSPVVAEPTIITDDTEYFTSNAWAGVEYPGLSLQMDGEFGSLTVESFEPTITFHFSTPQCDGLKLSYQYTTPYNPMLVFKNVAPAGTCLDSFTLVPSEHFITMLVDTLYFHVHVRDLNWNTPDQLVVLDQVEVYMEEVEQSCETCH